MNTQEIEALYIAHAADFRELLGRKQLVAEIGDGVSLTILGEPTSPAWHVLGCAEDCSHIPTVLAIAAMTEAWREGLDREHGIFIARRSHYDTEAVDVFNHRRGLAVLDDGYDILRIKNGHLEQLLPQIGWVRSDNAPGRRSQSAASVPEAIVAAVKTLADEKRATRAGRDADIAAKTNDARWSGPEYVTGLDGKRRIQFTWEGEPNP
jgi:hypothetical protein